MKFNSIRTYNTGIYKTTKTLNKCEPKRSATGLVITKH